MLKSILNEGGKALYLVPLRALANEKYEEFKKYEQIGVKVAISTGDYDSTDKWLEKYDVIIVTNEKCLSPDEDIIIVKDGNVEIIPISKLFNSLVANGTGVVLYNQNKIDVIPQERLYTIAYDFNLNNIVLSPILCVSKILNKDHLVRLRFEGGRSLTVTTDHKIFALERGRVVKKLSKNVLGSFVLALRDSSSIFTIKKITEKINDKLAMKLLETPLSYLKVISNDIVQCVDAVFNIQTSHGNYFTGEGILVSNCDSLLRHHSPWINKLTVIVADEIHLINDPHRGPTLEVVLSRLKQVNPNAQFLALSATIKNAEEIANWLNAKLVLSNWRPVILKEGVFDGEVIEFNDGTIKRPKIFDSNPVVSLAIDTVYEGGQSLVFFNTRRSAVSMATRIAKILPKLLSKTQQRALAEVADEILRKGTRTQQSEKLAELVKRGVAFHHAGLHYEHRKVIENNFRQNIIKIICATPTLAAGVNLPARRVIIRDYYRYESDLGRYPIPILEYKQQAGRAGRPKYDKYGEAVLVAKSEEEKKQLFETYIFGEPERIWSKLANEQVLRTHVLSTISAGYANSEEFLLKFINETFYAYQYDPENIRSVIRKILNFLITEELLVEKEQVFLPTSLGKRTSELYIDPLTAVIIRDALINAEKEKTTTLSFLHLISHTPDMVKLYLRRKDYQKFMEIVDMHYDEFLVKVPDYLTQPTEYEWFLSEVKVAQLLQDWIDEKTEDEILENYGIGSGDLLRIVETADWLLYATEEIAKIIKRDDLISEIWKIRQRVKHGVREELLELVRLKGIGRIRARILYKYGFKTIFDLQKATVKELLSLPLIGPEIVKNVKKQIGGEISEGDTLLLKKEKKKQKRLTDYG